MTKTLFNPVAERVENLCKCLVADYSSRWPEGSKAKFSVKAGRKYFKIIHDDSCVHGFIDKVTGDVFKPASWRGPADIVRYNLLDETSYEKCCFNADWAGSYLYIR